MNELQLPVCALFLSLLLCFVFFTKKRVKIIENKIYSVMIVMGLIDSFIITIERLLVVSGKMSNVTPLIKNILQITNKLDFVTLIILTTCLFLYSVLISWSKAKNKIKLLINITGVIDLIFFVVIFLLDVDLIEANNIISVSGTSILPTYLLCGIYLAGSILVSLFNIKNITKRHIPIISIIFIFAFLMFVFKINPYVMVISITVTMVNYLMYFTIENPDVRMIEELSRRKQENDNITYGKNKLLQETTQQIKASINRINKITQSMVTQDASIKSAINEISQNINDISNITNRSLDISSLDVKNIKIIDNDYDLKKVLDYILLKAKKNVKPGVDLRTLITSDVPEKLYGDEIRIKQIINTCLNNAIKHTEKGFIEFSVNTIVKNDVCRIIMTFEDSGKGIDEYYLNDLLNNNKNLDDSEVKIVDNNDVNLRIVKKIVSMFNGTFDIKSSRSGTTIMISIDQRIVSQKENNQSEVEKEILNRKKVLLVTQDNDIYKKISKVISNYEADYIVCSASKDCLDRIRDGEKYDVILVQENMDKIDAHELLFKLKLEEVTANIILLTNRTDKESIRKNKSEGFADFISLPLNNLEVKEKLENYIK